MVCGVAVGQQKQGGASGDEAALLALESKWDAASLKGDATSLGGILGDTFVTTSPEGKMRSKAETLQRIKSGAVKYQSSKVSDMKVAIYGDAAVVTGTWKGKYVENGKTIDATERFTDTFVRQNGQWKCVSSHSSNVT
jgi:ketosteroid isomerase-like protein